MQNACFACQNDPFAWSAGRLQKIPYRVWHDLGSSEFPRDNLSKDSKGQSCRRHALLPRMILCMECGIILFLVDEHQRR